MAANVGSGAPPSARPRAGHAGAALVTHAQAHAFKEIALLKLHLLRTIIASRAAYEEIGLRGWACITTGSSPRLMVLRLAD